MGFAALEAVLIVVIVVLVGGTGYFVYHANKKTNDTLNSAAKVAQSSPKFAKKKTVAKSVAPAPAPTTPAPAATNYLTVAQWGVEVKMNDAGKVTYTYNSTCQDVAGSCDSSISLQVKPEFLQDKTCNISVGMSRFSSIDPRFAVNFKKVGNYYFETTGSPYNCGNDVDNNLNTSLKNEFILDNLQQT